jgi:hypothetical protein
MILLLVQHVKKRTRSWCRLCTRIMNPRTLSSIVLLVLGLLCMRSALFFVQQYFQVIRRHQLLLVLQESSSIAIDAEYIKSQSPSSAPPPLQVVQEWNSTSVSGTTNDRSTTLRRHPIGTTSSSGSGSVAGGTNLPLALNHTNIPSANKRIGPEGQPGYVHDPTFLLKKIKRSRNDSTVSSNITTIMGNNSRAACAKPGEGPEGIEGSLALSRIRHYMESSSEVSRNVTLFCAVFTHRGGVRFTDAIQDTWGKRCNGILFASDNSNLTTGHTHIPSNSVHGFGYQGMAQRTRAILAYLYDNFLTSFDFFHISGDDTYLIVENLKEFLAFSREWEKSTNENGEERYVFAGFLYHWGNPKKNPELQHYLGGGSGYTFSAKALKAYVEGPLQFCHTHVEKSNEDMYISNCFYEYLSKDLIDTRDSTGAQRYHQLSVDKQATFLTQYSSTRKKGVLMIAINNSIQHQNEVLGKPVHYDDKQKFYVSNSSVAFHYHKSPDYLYRYEYLLYGPPKEMQCKNALISSK